MAEIYDFHGRHDSRVPQKIEDLAFAVIGAAIEVHRHLGPGLSEIQHKNAMCHELTRRGIPYAVEVEVDVIYKGICVGKTRMDLLVGDLLIVELKAVELLIPKDSSQALMYCKLKHLPLALPINFNVAMLRGGVKRVVNTV